MRRTLLAAAALAVGYGTAAAQVVIEAPPPDVYVATPYAYGYDYYTYRAEPRVYRYYRDVDDDVVVVRPRYRGACSPDHFWDGRRCIYFRY